MAAGHSGHKAFTVLSQRETVSRKVRSTYYILICQRSGCSVEGLFRSLSNQTVSRTGCSAYIDGGAASGALPPTLVGRRANDASSTPG